MGPRTWGTPGNEVTDLLAREASLLMGLEPFLAMGQHSIKEKLRSEELRLRDVSWHQTIGLRQTNSRFGQLKTIRNGILTALSCTIVVVMRATKIIIVCVTTNCNATYFRYVVRRVSKRYAHRLRIRVLCC